MDGGVTLFGKVCGHNARSYGVGLRPKAYGKSSKEVSAWMRLQSHGE